MAAARPPLDMMRSIFKPGMAVKPKTQDKVIVKKPKAFQSSRPNKPRLTQKELDIKFAKNLLGQGHHLQHKSALQKISTVMAGSGPCGLGVHFTDSPLSSASLLASLIKHRVIRNQESMTPMSIRKIIDYAEARNPVWSHSSSQLARRVQFKQSLHQMELSRELLQVRLELDQGDDQLKRKLHDLNQSIQKTELIICHIEERATGSLHPDTLLSGEKASLTPNEAAMLPSPSGTIRGVLIRIKGPRKGNRALKQQKASGRVSINSVGYVNYEDCSLQIPSKLGIFGLYVRLVYSKADRLVSAYERVPVLGDPKFKFIDIKG